VRCSHLEKAIHEIVSIMMRRTKSGPPRGAMTDSKESSCVADLSRLTANTRPGSTLSEVDPDAMGTPLGYSLELLL
jgi:hypothetical protein